MMEHLNADQPEIIRSHQKDEFLVDRLKNDISSSFFEIFGARIYLKFKKELDMLANLLYFYATTCCGFQTLGEEYCSMIQVDKKTGKIPSLGKLRATVLMSCLGPYIGDKLMTILRSKIDLVEGTRKIQNFSFDELFRWIENASSVLTRIHLALFYFQGYFYQISKRIFGVRYIVIREYLKDASAKISYKYLAVLFGVRLVLVSQRLLRQMFKMIHVIVKSRFQHSPSNETSELDNGLTREIQADDSYIKTELKCPLCLNNIIHMTATTCGHLFCWRCIIDWCFSRSECPVCRDEISPSRLIYIMNF